MDRRVEKTRKAIFNAFISLLNKKDFEEISITAIAKVADVNRVTVYKHFVDKYDLLDKCIDDKLSVFLADCKKDAVYEVTYSAFEYLYDNRTTFTLLLKAAGNGVLHKKFAASFMEREYLHNFAQGNTELYTTMKTHFLVSAIAGVFEWWLTAPDSLTVKDACDTLFSIISEIYPDYDVSGIFRPSSVSSS